MPKRLAGRNAGTPGADPHRGLRDAPPNPSVAPAGIRSSRGSRQETEDSSDLRRQAARGTFSVGPRGPGRDLSAQWTPADRVPGHPAGQGSPRPLGTRGKGIHRRLQVGFRARTRVPRSETRRGGNRGGDVLQAPEGIGGPVRPSALTAAGFGAPARSPPRGRSPLGRPLPPTRTKS